MEPKDENYKDRLLGKLPQPSNASDYRNEVAALLEKNDRSFRREKWMVNGLWIFCVGLSILFIWFGGARLDTPKAAWFACLGCFWFLYGAVELLKHVINRSRVELLKELKQVQLQVLELQGAIQNLASKG